MTKTTTDSEPKAKYSTRFKPGQSGNPGGRNPEREKLRRAILEWGPKALQGLVDLAFNSKSEKVKVDALKFIIDQCVGKAPVAITGEDGKQLTALPIEAILDAVKALKDK